MQLFYTLEGIDGCGKTSALKFLDDLFTQEKVPHVVVEAFPRDEDSMFLRELWISGKMPRVSELGIILELRKRVLQTQVIPALASGKVVISDRYNDSSWVYQVMTRGVSNEIAKPMFEHELSIIRRLGQSRDDRKMAVFNQLKAYKTLHLSVNPARAAQRTQKRGALDGLEKEGVSFFEKLNKNYMLHYEKRRRKGDVHFIDADRSELDVRGSLIKYFTDQGIIKG